MARLTRPPERRSERARVAAENRQIFGPRLRDEQPIERIAMHGWEGSDAEGVVELHRKDLEGVPLGLLGDEYIGSSVRRSASDGT